VQQMGPSLLSAAVRTILQTPMKQLAITMWRTHFPSQSTTAAS